MQKVAFWCFFGFGVITALLALTGGLWALSRSGAAGSNFLGFLLLFFAGSLALMLGSLVYIRKREKDLSKKGGSQ